MYFIDHPYKPRPWIMLLCVLFFGAVAAGASNEALTNDRGLILNGIFHFETPGATRFYWGIAGLGGAFVLAGLAGFVFGLVATGRIRLSATELSVPRSGFSSTATVIPRQDIRSVHLMAVNRQRFLTVEHAKGTLSIAESCLPSKAAFDEVRTALGAS